jgi:hypothetical protein
MPKNSSTTPTTGQPLMYDVQAAARLWGVSPRQVRRWISEGRIDRVKPAGPTGPVYITRTEIERRIQESGPSRRTADMSTINHVRAARLNPAIARECEAGHGRPAGHMYGAPVPPKVDPYTRRSNICPGCWTARPIEGECFCG